MVIILCSIQIDGGGFTVPISLSFLLSFVMDIDLGTNGANFATKRTNGTTLGTNWRQKGLDPVNHCTFKAIMINSLYVWINSWNYKRFRVHQVCNMLTFQQFCKCSLLYTPIYWGIIPQLWLPLQLLQQMSSIKHCSLSLPDYNVCLHVDFKVKIESIAT